MVMVDMVALAHMFMAAQSAGRVMVEEVEQVEQVEQAMLVALVEPEIKVARVELVARVVSHFKQTIRRFLLLLS
jgi:hypothetical protein